MRLELAGLASLALLLGVPPRVAEACHPPMCADQIVLPRAGQSMPANAKAILLYPRVKWGQAPAALEVRLERETAAGPVELATQVTPRTDGSYAVAPIDNFQPNASYLLTVPDYCEGSGKLDSTALQHKLGTAASAPLPNKLGTVQLTSHQTGSLTVATTSGSCSSETTSVHADVRVALAPEATPWSSLLVHEARVDGQPFAFSESLAWDLGPFIGSAEKIYSVCSASDPGVFKGVEPGQHPVTFRAVLPGTGLVLETPPLILTLSCPVPTDDPALRLDSSPPAPADGGVLPSGSDGALQNDAVERSGCSMAGRGARGLPLPLPLVLVPLLLLRRRHAASRAKRSSSAK